MTELLEGIYTKLQGVNLKTYFNILPADIDTNAIYIVYEVSTTNSDNSLYQKNYANNLDITVKILGKDALELFKEGEKVKGALLGINDIVFRSSIPVFADYDLGVNQYTLKFEVQSYGHVFKLLTYKELNRYTIQELKEGLTEEQISELQEHLPLSDYTIQQLQEGLTVDQIEGLQLFKPLPDYTIQELQDGLTQDQIDGLQYIPSSFEPETMAFKTRVEDDGGKILDINKLDSFYKVNKYNGLYNSLQFAVSKQFGYKLDGSGNIIKIYDASKNGNDLDVTRGEVPEDLENDMFFLYDTFAKTDNVVFDNLNTNNAITFVSDLIPPIQEDIEQARKVGFSIGDGSNSYIYFFVGGSATGNYTSPSARLRYSSADGIIDMTNPNPQIPEKQNSSWRIDFENKTFVNYRNGELLINSTHGALDIEKSVNVQKIVLGGANNESTPSDADCYLNNTFLYNDYLTDQQLADINSI